MKVFEKVSSYVFLKHAPGISLPQKCLKKCADLNVGKWEIHVNSIVMRNVNIGEDLEIFAKILSDHSYCFFNDLKSYTYIQVIVLYWTIF